MWSKKCSHVNVNIIVRMHRVLHIISHTPGIRSAQGQNHHCKDFFLSSQVKGGILSEM